MLKIYITASAVLAWQEGLKSVHCQYWVDYRRCMDDDSDAVISWFLWPGAGIEGKAGGAFKRRQSLSVSLQNFFNIFIIWIFFYQCRYHHTDQFSDPKCCLGLLSFYHHFLVIVYHWNRSNLSCYHYQHRIAINEKKALRTSKSCNASFKAPCSHGPCCHHQHCECHHHQKKKMKFFIRSFLLNRRPCISSPFVIVISSLFPCSSTWFSLSSPFSDEEGGNDGGFNVHSSTSKSHLMLGSGKWIFSSLWTSSSSFIIDFWWGIDDYGEDTWKVDLFAFHSHQFVIREAINSKNKDFLWNHFIKWRPLPPVPLLWSPY